MAEINKAGCPLWCVQVHTLVKLAACDEMGLRSASPKTLVTAGNGRRSTQILK